MTSSLALTATSSTGVITSAEPISLEMAQKRITALFQMLTAEYQTQLKMNGRLGAAFKSIKSVEMHEGVLFLKQEDGHVIHQKISSDRIKKLRKAVQVYEKSNDPSLIKIQFAEVIREAIAFFSLRIRSLSASWKVALKDNGTHLISGVDFTDFFKDIIVDGGETKMTISKLFCLKIDKNNEIEVALQGIDYPLSHYPSNVKKAEDLYNQIQMAGGIAYDAFDCWSQTVLRKNKAAYCELPISDSSEIETVNLARFILLRKGVPEGCIRIKLNRMQPEKKS